MFWVYILRSVNYRRAIYIGYTADLSARLLEHNKGLSVHTKKYMPWAVVYCEGYAYEQDAKDREKSLKQFGRVYSRLKVRIARSLQSGIKARG